MTVKKPSLWLVSLAVVALGSLPHITSAVQLRRNAIVFVADALRHGAVTEQDAPALSALRSAGVHFENSHSLFPTFTTANGPLSANGHHLGDTGDYSNVIWGGFATFDNGNFALSPGTPTPFIENDRVLADLDDHQAAISSAKTRSSASRAPPATTPLPSEARPNRRSERGGPRASESRLLALPRRHRRRRCDRHRGGTTASSDASKRSPSRDSARGTDAVERIGATSQFNNDFFGDHTKGGTLAANVVQQQWFADAVTRVILPSFAATPDKPFVLVFWSRDPDGSQHNGGDSLNTLAPGVNGPT